MADALSPTETLRAAAAKLRTLAGNATPGEWYPDWDSGVYAMPDTSAKYVISGGSVTYDNTQWIALVHPGIAGPLAGWLEREAFIAESVGGAQMAESPDGYLSWPLAVARILLGASDGE